MDLDKFFNLMDGDSPNMDSYISETSSISLDFRDSPEYKLGMFVKIIMDHLQFNKRVVDWFKQVDEEFDKEDIKLAGEFVVHHRAWFYIKDFNPEVSYLTLEKQSSLKTLTALKLSTHFFEEREEYEKCAHLHSIVREVEGILS